MIKFTVSIIEPPNHPHQALQEMGELVYYGLLELGYDCVFTNNLDLKNRQYIIIGANLLYIYPIELPANSIIYNFEQIYANSPWLKAGYIDYLLQYPVWDYSQINIKQLNAFGVNNVEYVPVGYVPQMTRIPKVNYQDIDVLFYGSINERRQAIIDELQSHGLKVEVLFGVYGTERDNYIARSKIILNLHFYEAQVFEVVRVSYLLANRQFVISEKGSDSQEETAFSAGLIFCEYEELVNTCLYYLTQPEKRENIALTGFNLMCQRSESNYLQTVINKINFQVNQGTKFIKDFYRKRQAKNLLDNGLYQNAIALYEETLQVDSDCLESYWYLGLALLYNGDELTAQLTWFSGISQAEENGEDNSEIMQQLLTILEKEMTKQLNLNNVFLANKIQENIKEIFTQN